MVDLQAGIRTGPIVSVEPAPESASLVGDHAVGATTLTVSTGGMFYSAGRCRVGSPGVHYDYTRDGDTLLIAAPGLTAAAEDGTPVVSLSPSGRPEARRVANVDLDGFGEPPVEALIPTGEHDYYPIGLRLAGSLVNVASDGGYGYETKGRPHEQPLMDPAGLDPDPETPAPWDPDGVPPDYSPVPQLLSGIGSVIVHWQEVPNHDPVTYDVYMDDASPVTVGTGTFVGTMKGSMIWIRALGDGSVLVPGTEYFVKLVAKDADGSAAPSEEASIVLQTNIDALMKINATNITEDMVESPLIQAKIMNTVILNASIITADEAWIEAINGAVVTGNTIQTSNDPTTGIKIGATYGGLKAYDGTGVSSSIDQTTGYITGKVVRTGTSGQRVELVDASTSSGGYSALELYTGATGEQGPAEVRANTVGSALSLLLKAPIHDAAGPGAPYFQLNNFGSSSYIDAYAGATFDLNAASSISLEAPSVTIHGASSVTLQGDVHVTGDLTVDGSYPGGGGGGGGFVPGSGDLAMGGYDLLNVDTINPGGSTLTVGGTLAMGGHNISDAGAIVGTSLDVGSGSVDGFNIVADNRVRSMGTFGAWGSIGPAAKPARPGPVTAGTVQEQIVAILTAYGLCA